MAGQSQLRDWTGFDPFDESVRDDPYPHYTMLREQAPCVRLERYGVWLVTRYADSAAVLQDWETFSSATGAALEPAATPEEGGVILSTDPPEHTRIRRAVARDFTPKAIRALEPRLRELVGRALDVALVEDQFDWVTLVAQPVPTTLMAELMGYPDRYREQYCRWASVVFNSMGCPADGSSDFGPVAEVGAQLYGFVSELAANHEYVPGGWADRIVQAGEEQCLKPVDRPAEAADLLGGVVPSR